MSESPFRDLVDRARVYREIIPVVQNAASDAFGTESTNELLNDAAARLRLAEHGRLLIEAHYQLAVVGDHACYDLVRDGKTAIQRYHEGAEPAADPDEQAVREALTRTRWIWLRVLAIDPGVAAIGTDALFDRTRIVISPEVANVYGPGTSIATRVIELSDVNMPVGGTMPLDAPAERAILADLGERFPYRRRKGLGDLTPYETADLHRILANAALDGIARFFQTTEAMAEESQRHGSPATSHPSGQQLPRGQRPKPPRPKGKEPRRKR